MRDDCLHTHARVRTRRARLRAGIVLGLHKFDVVVRVNIYHVYAVRGRTNGPGQTHGAHGASVACVFGTVRVWLDVRVR